MSLLICVMVVVNLMKAMVNYFDRARIMALWNQYLLCGNFVSMLMIILIEIDYL